MVTLYVGQPTIFVLIQLDIKILLTFLAVSESFNRGMERWDARIERITVIIKGLFAPETNFLKTGN
jgi:hypothetical protein